MREAFRGLSVMRRSMLRQAGFSISTLILAIALAGCGSPEAPQSKPAAPEKAAVAALPAEASKESASPAPTAPAAAAKEAAPQTLKAEDYFYNPSGRRDPFMSLLVLERESDRARMAGDIPPLERHAIPEMRVIGIVAGTAG